VLGRRRYDKRQAARAAEAAAGPVGIGGQSLAAEGGSR
jgi:hypothetical protein